MSSKREEINFLCPASPSQEVSGHGFDIPQIRRNLAIWKERGLAPYAPAVTEWLLSALDRVASLEAELEKARAQSETWREIAVGTPPVVFPEDLAFIVAENERLKEDKERLDWLEGSKTDITSCADEGRAVIEWEHDGYTVSCITDTTSSRRHAPPSLREAIDAARAARSEGSDGE